MSGKHMCCLWNCAAEAAPGVDAAYGREFTVVNLPKVQERKAQSCAGLRQGRVGGQWMAKQRFGFRQADCPMQRHGLADRRRGGGDSGVAGFALVDHAPCRSCWLRVRDSTNLVRWKG
ncbi:hypothetical protein DM194_13450 (plasmid) [Azospirillum ramasamyi]|uniref:Uncharacterized protein n=1 Tax=Azospirillum ramasamyi TaxID=682998 RepID=A0A2U9S7F5_9PROT|nr:hypothetical protein DM194_13450 [Azospirillum ramasamyi]